MLNYMTTPGVGSSPLAVAALALMQGGATVADLERRFSENRLSRSATVAPPCTSASAATARGELPTPGVVM
jgi:hypothetical protein